MTKKWSFKGEIETDNGEDFLALYAQLVEAIGQTSDVTLKSLQLGEQ